MVYTIGVVLNQTRSRSMKKMTLTFMWTDDGHGDDKIIAEKEFTVKSEPDVKKDISAWVKDLYKYTGDKSKHFEVGRKFIGVGGQRCTWIVYGNKTKFNWNVNFMSWAENIMVCTLAYLGWERDIDLDRTTGSGFTFISSSGVVKKFKNLTELDKFIIEEMGVEARLSEIG